MDKYAYSFDGEHYSEKFDSKKQALKEALTADHEEGGKIYIGVCEDYILCIDVEHILEDIAEMAYNECGECSDDYLSDVSKDELEELQEELNEVLLSWAEKYGHMPEFYKVHELEVHEYEKGKNGKLKLKKAGEKNG